MGSAEGRLEVLGFAGLSQEQELVPIKRCPLFRLSLPSLCSSLNLLPLGLFLFHFSRQGFLCVAALDVLELFLCRPDWPQTHRDPPASASRVLRLKACTTTAQPASSFYPLPQFPACVLIPRLLLISWTPSFSSHSPSIAHSLPLSRCLSSLLLLCLPSAIAMYRLYSILLGQPCS